MQSADSERDDLEPGADDSSGQASAAKQLVVGSGIFSVGILGSKLFAVVREMLVQRRFGPGLTQDAYIVAENGPRLASALLTDLQRSCTVPVLGRHLVSNDSERFARVLVWSTLFTALTLLAATLAVVVFADPLTAALARGYDAAERAEVSGLLRVLVFMLLVEGVAGMATAGWLASRNYAVPGLAQLIPNAIVVAYLLVWGAERGIEGYAWANLAGSTAIGLVVTAPFLWKLPLVRTLTAGPPREDLKRILGLAWPILIPALMGPVVLTSERSLATMLEPGALSCLRAAQTVVDAPVGTLVAAIGTVLLPVLAHQAATRGEAVFRERVATVARVVLIMVTPAVVLVASHASVLVRGLYEWGKFSPQHTIVTADIARVLAWGSLLAALASVMRQAFVALENTRTPSAVQVLSQSSHLLAMNGLFGRFGLWALVGSRLVAPAVSFTCLNLLLGRRLGRASFRGSLSFFARLAFCAAVMVGAAWAAGLVMRHPGPAVGRMGEIAWMVGTLAVCLPAYVVAARLLHPAEFEAIRSRLSRRRAE